MTEDRHDAALVVGDNQPEIRNKTRNLSVILQGEAGAADYVAHLSPSEVGSLADAAGQSRHGDRDSLMIRVTYDAALRISETLGLRMCDLVATRSGYVLHILGKGNRAGVAAISDRTAEQIMAYAWQYKLQPEDRIFEISRTQAFRIITAAYERSGIRQPSKAMDHVGRCHVLRHSGAIERLRASGNPRSVQAQLRHRTALTTMRYLKTLSADESLKIQQGVNPW